MVGRGKVENGGDKKVGRGRGWKMARVGDRQSKRGKVRRDCAVLKILLKNAGPRSRDSSACIQCPAVT